MVDLDVVGCVRAGKTRRGSWGAIGFSSAFGEVTGGRGRAGGEAGVGGTRVGAAEYSDQRGVAGRAWRGRRAGLVGSMTLPSFRTRAVGTERLRSRECGHGLLSQSKTVICPARITTVVRSVVSIPCSSPLQSKAESSLEESLLEDSSSGSCADSKLVSGVAWIDSESLVDRAR